MDLAIGLILDVSSDQCVDTLCKQMPVWILSSETNAAIVEGIVRRINDCHITLLLARSNESASDLLSRALYDIDQHHGHDSTSCPYHEIWVIGADIEDIDYEVMKDIGLTSVSKTDFGFKILR